MGTPNTDGSYTVTRDEVEAFHRDGFVHLPRLLSEDEVAELEVVYDRFLRGDRGAGQGLLRHGGRLWP